MDIRIAKKSDIPELLVLVEQMVEYHVAIDPYYKPFVKYTGLEEEIGEWLLNKDMLVLVAEENGMLAGYAQVSVEPAPTYAAVKKIGVIYDVFVVGAQRRKKIAHALMEKAMEWFGKKKVKYIELSVDARNEAGVGFWKSIGFSGCKLRMRLERENG